jgi:hypothetical protein
MICHVDVFKSKHKMKPNGAKTYAKPASTMFLFRTTENTFSVANFSLSFNGAGWVACGRGRKNTLRIRRPVEFTAHSRHSRLKTRAQFCRGNIDKYQRD